jgi:hypothetical protein
MGEEQRRKYLADLVSKNENCYQDFIYIKLFEILSTQNFTSNSNGIFINLNDITDKTIEDSIKFIETINISSVSYLESESNRDKHLELLKHSVNRRTTSVTAQVKVKVKKNKARQAVYKQPKLTGVYKRLTECMGRRGHVRKLEVFEDPSDHESEEDELFESKLDEDELFESKLDEDELFESKLEEDYELFEDTLKDLGLDDED